MQIVREYPKMALYEQGGVPLARVRLKGGERHSKSFPGMDIEEAQGAALEWYASQPWAQGMDAGESVDDVMRAYLRTLEAHGYPHNTVKTYKSCNRCYVRPNIGSVPVRSVKPYMVESLYNTLMLKGAADGGGVSTKTIAKVHGFLKRAFAWMVGMGIIESSPMDRIQKPKVDATEAAAYTEREVATLTEALGRVMEDDSRDACHARERNAAFCAYLSLHTGMRCGEVCALTYGDIRGKVSCPDRHPVSLHVAHTAVQVEGAGVVRQDKAKTRSSARNIAVSRDVADAICMHVVWLIGILGDISSDTPLCTVDGRFIAPATMSRMFSALRRELGLPDGTSFHTLRHTHATMLLMHGTDIKTIQERLGHSRPETTLSLYAHVLPGRDQAAAEAFGEIVREGGNG